jgi:hypothetical protein
LELDVAREVGVPSGTERVERCGCAGGPADEVLDIPVDEGDVQVTDEFRNLDRWV